MQPHFQVSVAALFDNLHGQVLDDVEQLNYIDSGDTTDAQITETVAKIKTPIVAAIPELQVLVGAEQGVILAPVDGKVELTVGQVAVIVGVEVQAILSGAGAVLAVGAQASGTVDADAQKVLADLGATVTALVMAVIVLDVGIFASLAA